MYYMHIFCKTYGVKIYRGQFQNCFSTLSPIFFLKTKSFCSYIYVCTRLSLPPSLLFSSFHYIVINMQYCFPKKKLISFRNWFLVETFDNYYCVYCTWKEVVCMPLFVIILKQGFRVLWIAKYCFSFYVFET